MTIEVNVIVPTNGKGLWSNRVADVRIVGYELAYVNEEADFGELRVYFDEDTWDVDNDGLIYTDPRFYQELHKFLSKEGIDAEFGYSEQGMQGDDYVSFDVEADFIEDYFDKEKQVVA